MFGSNFQACKEKLHVHEDNVREAVNHYDILIPARDIYMVEPDYFTNPKF